LCACAQGWMGVQDRTRAQRRRRQLVVHPHLRGEVLQRAILPDAVLRAQRAPKLAAHLVPALPDLETDDLARHPGCSCSRQQQQQQQAQQQQRPVGGGWGCRGSWARGLHEARARRECGAAAWLARCALAFTYELTPLGPRGEGERACVQTDALHACMHACACLPAPLPGGAHPPQSSG